MNSGMTFIVFLLGLIIGGGAAWLIARARATGEAHLADKFKDLATGTLLPVQQSLEKMDGHIRELESKREGAYREVLKAVEASNQTQQYLRAETSQLLQALHSSTMRGSWCQVQLKRVFELAGMAEHLKDFSAQVTINAPEGILRPDYVVSLSGNRNVIFDCKVPLTAYLEYTKTEDHAAKKELLAKHTRLVRDHIRALSAKEYWSHFDATPEFVVMFMPENLLGAALDNDPEIFDYGIKQRIVLATPTTVLAVMWSVAYGWKEEALRDNVRKIGELGGEIYSSLTAMNGYIEALGKRLSGALESYNQMIGSIDRNVLSKARRLKDYGAANGLKSLPEALEPIDLQPRKLTQASEPPANEDAA